MFNSAFYWVGNFLSEETAFVFLAFQLLQCRTVSYRVAQLWLLNGVHITFEHLANKSRIMNSQP